MHCGPDAPGNTEGYTPYSWVFRFIAVHDITTVHIDCYAWSPCGCNIRKSYEMRCRLGFDEGSEILRDWSPGAPVAQDFGALAKA